jgi:hypothetical protein
LAQHTADVDIGADHLKLSQVLHIWTPLTLAWLLMCAEGPILAAIIARQPNPEVNLAAFGICIAFLLITESPVLNLVTAGVALGGDRGSFGRLRQFGNKLSIACSLVLMLVSLPWIFRSIVGPALGLPEEVTLATADSLWLLIPCPFAVGTRRMLQGVLVRNSQTRAVTTCTVGRILAMSITAAGLCYFTELSAAVAATAGLMAGMVSEAFFVRLAASGVLTRMPEQPPYPAPEVDLVSFYTPLAITLMVNLSVQPLISFSLSHGVMPLESLAVIPVLNSLNLLFRTGGIAFQEVSITLLGREVRHQKELRKIAFGMTVASFAAYGLLAFTPLLDWWLIVVSSLSPELADFARWPAQIMALLPALAVANSWFRAVTIIEKRNSAIGYAAFIELLFTGLVLYAGIALLEIYGAWAAAWAMVLGQFAGCAFLWLRGKPKYT